jgi:hypothetical protein
MKEEHERMQDLMHSHRVKMEEMELVYMQQVEMSRKAALEQGRYEVVGVDAWLRR